MQIPSNPRIYVGPLPYVELVSCLSSLAEGEALPFSQALQLAPEAVAFIQRLKKFRVKGCEFFEFALALENPAVNQPRDLTRILRSIHSLSDHAFVHTLFGEELSHEVIDILLRHFDKLDFLLSKELQQGHLNHEELEAVFLDIQAFRAGFESAARSLAPFVKQADTNVTPVVERVSLLLESGSPLEVAQTLMGKTFKRISDYSQYWFVPSGFYHRRAMRTFSSSILMTILPLEQRLPEVKSTDLVRFLKALGDTSRLAIVGHLAEGPCSGKELASRLSLRTATITHHLDQLRQCGLLHEERDRNTKFVSLNKIAYDDYLKALQRSIR